MALAKHETTDVVANNTVQRAPQERMPIFTWVFGLLACISMLLSIALIFLYAPTEATQGIAQRIMYFHVPSAWIGMLGFIVTAIAGCGYIITRKDWWDWLARASAECGAVFITLALITGSIWGKTTWGTWWAWEPRLTTTLILWFIYIAYIMLRSYMGRSESSAYYGAVLAIIGVLDIPIIYLSVQWWRTLHPGPQSNLPTSAALTLVVAVVAFTLLYAFMVTQLYQLERLQTLAQRLRASVEYERE